MRSLNCPLWRKLFSVCCGRFSKTGHYIILRTKKFALHVIVSVVYVHTVCTHTCGSSCPPEIKLSECAFALRSNFHSRVCISYIGDIRIAEYKWVVQFWTTQDCDLFSAELVNMFNKLIMHAYFLKLMPFVL